MKWQRGSDLQKRTVVINTAKTNHDHLYAIQMLIMPFTFAALTHVAISHLTTEGYRTKHGQAIRTESIEEFVLSAWTCLMCVNSLSKSLRIA